MSKFSSSNRKFSTMESSMDVDGVVHCWQSGVGEPAI